MLTMTTLITNTNSELPKINHLTALDVYLFTCFTLVFASLIEYAVVGYFDMVKETSADENDEIGDEKREAKKLENHRKANSIDLVSRKLFPAVFGLFNVLYVLAMAAIMLRNSLVDIDIEVEESGGVGF